MCVCILPLHTLSQTHTHTSPAAAAAEYDVGVAHTTAICFRILLLLYVRPLCVRVLLLYVTRGSEYDAAYTSVGVYVCVCAG
jgi:hypothetical protein